MQLTGKTIEFDLPLPWITKKFKTSTIGYINFLVGPNGSGKSRFAQALKNHLGNVRLLGTDRLSGMEQIDPLRNIFRDRLQGGFEKSHFQQYKNAGQQGSGIDTLVILEERVDLRIQVEATLSHLFNRKIFLEWDSGRLLARATLGATGASYRLDREECHGIKELLVLLTNLYNDEYQYLIIDEPELNLHPQYQAFFMQEVRKVAGDPSNKKKVIFLITHSPFMLDFRTVDDLRSIISFSLSHEAPRQIYDLDSQRSSRIESLVPRLNVHHKQLFFSDNPIFVEGILDVHLIAAMQEARGVSVAGAGSCIIDAGGCEEVNKYLELCLAFGKNAYFLYDLDSLFGGNLKACIGADNKVQSFLSTAGVGASFAKYCGELDRKLTKMIDMLLLNTAATPLPDLMDYLRTLGERSFWDGKALAKARVAVLTAISKYQVEMSRTLGSDNIDDVNGRLHQVAAALKEKNVFLLTGGTLERYLPSYQGSLYELHGEAKKQAVEQELNQLTRINNEGDLKNRYGDLYEAICCLPSKLSVDVDPVIKGYLSQYIHDLQSAIVSNPSWNEQEMQVHLGTIQKSTAKVLSIRKIERSGAREFSAEIVLAPMLGKGQRIVKISHTTNAGMGDFVIRDSNT